MNRLTKSSLKKLLLPYLIALALVLLYFISRLIFQDEKTIEYKHFATPSDKSIIQEDVPNERKKERSKFIVLPKE